MGLPLAGVLHTDISKDGTLQGASVETAVALGRRLPVPIIMAGGVSSLADIRGAAESGRHSWCGLRQIYLREPL